MSTTPASQLLDEHLPIFKDDRDQDPRNDGIMAEEFRTVIIPDLRQLLLSFVSYSAQAGLPRPVVTQLVRSRKQQVDYYVGHWLALQIRLGRQDPTLTGRDLADAKAIRGKTHAELVAMAEARFTWHWVAAASDLRTTAGGHYTAAQLQRVVDWFRARCKAPQWELLVHDVTGPHLHVARRDFGWRERFTAAQPAAQ